MSEEGESSIQTKTPEMPGKREVTVDRQKGQVIISGERKGKGKVERSLLGEVLKRFPDAKASEFPDLMARIQAEGVQGKEEA